MDDDLTALVVADAREHMAKAVDHTQAEFGAVRTGRATPALVEHLKIDYYGTETELRQMAGFSVPEARLLVVSPTTRGLCRPSRRRSRARTWASPRPTTATVIRLSFPVPTEQRRKELVKVVKQKAEDGRVTVRNVRRSARHDLEAMQKDGDLSSDELERVEKDLDKFTQDHVAAIDKLLAHKEQELLEI
jgi:ribosome recycling factor